MENVARELPAMYADGIAMPAGTCTPDQRQTGHCRFLDGVNGFGSNRPSPRNVSNELFRQVQRNCNLFLINYDGSIVPLTCLGIYRHFALYSLSCNPMHHCKAFTFGLCLIADRIQDKLPPTQ